MGSYKELFASSSSFIDLLGDIHQHELKEHQSLELQKQSTIVDPIKPEADDKKDALSAPTNVEIKQEGIVRWHVYSDYLRSGVGLIFGLILLVGIFSAREFIAIFSDRWLAKWSDDEGRRYRPLNNCTNNTAAGSIQLMSDAKWNDHRNHRFYIYFGRHFC